MTSRTIAMVTTRLGQTAKGLIDDVLQRVLCRTNSVFKCATTYGLKKGDIVDPVIEVAADPLENAVAAEAKKELAELPAAAIPTANQAADVAVKAVERTVRHVDDLVKDLEALLAAAKK
jgi:hypothetical protein